MAARTPSRKVELGQFYTSDEVADLMVSLSRADRDARVLEPSCGPGVFLSALARAGFTDVTGTDIDPANVEAAKARATGASVRQADFLSLEDPDGFDLVIGNPPYVQWGNMTPQLRERLLGEPRFAGLANGQWDLLYAFMAGALELLRPGGELLFIVPSNWMNSTYAASLRRRLAQRGEFELVLHFGEFRLFADCYPNCLIFRYRTGEPAGSRIWVGDFAGRRGRVADVLAVARPHLERADAERQADQDSDRREGEWHFFTAPAFPAQGLWFLASAAERAEIEGIEQMCAGVELGARADIGVGVVSGRDQAFALGEEDMAAMPASEAGLVRRFVKAAHCTRYRVEGSAPLLFPDGVDEAWMASNAPWTLARLEAQREALEARYLSAGTPWFAWATVRNMPLFERTRDQGKIFIPCIDRAPRPRFSYTDQDLLGAGDVVMIAPAEGAREHVLYLLAWLNSDRVATWYRHKGSHSGQRARYTHAYLSRIPVPAIDWDDPVEAGLHDRIVGLTAEWMGDRSQPDPRGLGAVLESCFALLGAHRLGADHVEADARLREGELALLGDR